MTLNRGVETAACGLFVLGALPGCSSGTDGQSPVAASSHSAGEIVGQPLDDHDVATKLGAIAAASQEGILMAPYAFLYETTLNDRRTVVNAVRPFAEAGGSFDCDTPGERIIADARLFTMESSSNGPKLVELQQPSSDEEITSRVPEIGARILDCVAFDGGDVYTKFKVGGTEYRVPVFGIFPDGTKRVGTSTHDLSPNALEPVSTQ